MGGGGGGGGGAGDADWSARDEEGQQSLDLDYQFHPQIKWSAAKWCLSPRYRCGWHTSIVSKATLGRLLRDGAESVSAFLSDVMPSWTETEIESGTSSQPALDWLRKPPSLPHFSMPAVEPIRSGTEEWRIRLIFVRKVVIATIGSGFVEDVTQVKWLSVLKIVTSVV